MQGSLRQHSGAVVWSVALHIAIVGALMVGLRLPSGPPAVPSVVTPIQGVIIDQAAIERERQRKEREERLAREKVEAEKRAAEQAQRQRDEAAKREQERVAAERQERDRAAQAAKERAEAVKREKERLAQEQEAKEKRARDEAARKAAAAKQQAQAEADLQQSLAAENERREAEQAGLLQQYIALIENQIERNWIPPLSAKPGLECVVNVVQIPSGDVVDVHVGRCNGDDAVVRSIEAAVKKASPLPKPPVASLFTRNLNVTFKPQF